jgi:hypothetical protein
MMAEGISTDALMVDGNNTSYSQFEFKNKSPVIRGGESVTMQMPLLSGLFNCGKYLPLRFLQGLSIELVLVSNYKDAALITQADVTDTNNWTTDDPLWTISEPVIKCQVVTIDSGLENQFTQKLASGRSLPIQFTSFVTQIANAGNTQTPVVSITRAFNRLKACYVSMFKRTYMYNGAGTNNEEKYRGSECEHLGNVKEATMFYHPQYLYNGKARGDNPVLDYDSIDMDEIDQPPKDASYEDELGRINRDEGLSDARYRGYYKNNTKCEVSYQMILGSKTYPVHEVTTSQEAFYELLKTVGCHESYSTVALDILPREYRSWKYIIGCSFAHVPGSNFSGVSTRNGDLLTIKLKGCHHVNDEPVNGETILPYSTPEYIYVVLEHDAILNISDAGVTLFG